MACVYCHIRKDNNEPFYVGIGKTKDRAYALGHHSRNDWHKNIVRKYGINVYVIADDLSWEIAKKWEIIWIKALRNSDYNLVNLTNGGEGVLGLRMSDESRKKMSEAKKGKPSPKIGYSLSEEARRKISASLKGKGPSIEARSKGSAIRRKKIVCVTDGNKFNSVTEAANFYNLKNVGLISAVCNGKRKTAAQGRIFKYLSEVFI